METIESLKKHIQEEIAELNKLNGKDKKRYGLLDINEIDKILKEGHRGYSR